MFIHPDTGTVTSYQEITLSSEVAEMHDEFGFSVCGIGTFDEDDNITDFMVGTPGAEDDFLGTAYIATPGRVYIVFLQQSGNIKSMIDIRAGVTNTFTAILGDKDKTTFKNF